MQQIKCIHNSNYLNKLDLVVGSEISKHFSMSGSLSCHHGVHLVIHLKWLWFHKDCILYSVVTRGVYPQDVTNQFPIDSDILFLELYSWTLSNSPPSDGNLTSISQCCACYPAGCAVPGELLLTSGGETQQARGGSTVSLSLPISVWLSGD